MSQDQWAAVDRYINDLFTPPDAAFGAALQAALQDSITAGLPPINVSANQGKLLMILAQTLGAKNILEIGTLGGYSTLWLWRGLAPGGRLVTLEASDKHAKVARANIARAGASNGVELILGMAMETLPKLAAEKRGPFDLVFIDADKANTTEYFAWSVKLSRPGTLIIVDNVVRDGKVIDPASPDGSVQGVRRCLAAMAADPRVTATGIQTVGGKGYDGFAVARVNG